MTPEIVLRPVGELQPYLRNARTHDEEQIAAVAASIREFGFNAPILTRNGTVLAGHARLAAAQLLGLADVPTIDLSHLTDPLADLYVIADNRVALDADWDREMLATELEELVAEGFDLTLAGFEQEDLDSILAAASKDGSLAERFLVPPLSVIDAEADWWVERARLWAEGGIGEEASGPQGLLQCAALYELLLRWFSPDSGTAGLLGPTVALMRTVANCCGRSVPRKGQVDLAVVTGSFDQIPAFLKTLAENRFAVCLLPAQGREWRKVVQAFAGARCSYYNELVVTCTPPLMPNDLEASYALAGELVPAHMLVLVFVKGDPKAAVEYCGEVDVPDVDHD